MVTTLLEQDLFYRIVPLHPLSQRRQDPNLVDEQWPCDQSVINGPDASELRHQTVDDRSQLGLARLRWSHGCLTGSKTFCLHSHPIFILKISCKFFYTVCDAFGSLGISFVKLVWSEMIECKSLK
jgi:hypothetical protein